MNSFEEYGKALLKRIYDKYAYTRTEGGCETCGYGGTEVTVLDVDWEELHKEIDEFSKTFKQE